MQVIDSQILGNTPIGTANFLGYENQTALIIRDAVVFFEDLQHGPDGRLTLQMVSGIFLIDKLPLLITMIYSGENFYEVWWNYYESDNRQKLLDKMAEQLKCQVLLINEFDELIKKIVIDNPQPKIFSHYLELIKAAKPWTSVDFEAAVQQAYRLFPSKKVLLEEMIKNLYFPDLEN